jgi:hypothetical protein
VVPYFRLSPVCCARGEAERGVDVLDFIWFLYYVFFKANFHYFDNHMVCLYEYLKWEWLNILFCL